MKKAYSVTIGIDPGTNTGISVWSVEKQKFEIIDTVLIHQALEEVLYWMGEHANDIFLRIENAKTWRPYGKESREVTNSRLKGAGSITRDCSIWEHFCKDKKLDFEMVSLQSAIKKLNKMEFQRYTGVGTSFVTSEHARDAAMLVYDPKGIKNQRNESSLQYYSPTRSKTISVPRKG